MSNTTYKGFKVEITDEIGGYGFFAGSDDYGALMGHPNQPNDIAYLTPEIALAQAKRNVTKFLNAYNYQNKTK